MLIHVDTWDIWDILVEHGKPQKSLRVALSQGFAFVCLRFDECHILSGVGLGWTMSRWYYLIHSDIRDISVNQTCLWDVQPEQSAACGSLRRSNKGRVSIFSQQLKSFGVSAKRRWGALAQSSRKVPRGFREVPRFHVRVPSKGWGRFRGLK